MMTGLVKILVIFCVISASVAAYNQTVRKQEFQDGFCDTDCQIEIEASIQYTKNLHQESTKNHEDLLQRVVSLETESYSIIESINTLIMRVTNLETYLARNVSALNTKIVDEARATYDLSVTDLIIVRDNLNSRVNDVNTEVNKIKATLNNNGNTGNTGNGNPGAVMDVYYNITRRIDSLEYGRIANLTADNNIWRRNFRVVNATFEKIKQNNNCLCK